MELRDFNLNLENPMTEERLPLAELLAKAGDGDFLRNVAGTVLQMLMEADVEGLIEAGLLVPQGSAAATSGDRCGAEQLVFGELTVWWTPIK